MHFSRQLYLKVSEHVLLVTDMIDVVISIYIYWIMSCVLICSSQSLLHIDTVEYLIQLSSPL